ncbi:proteasome subunit beta [archaeon]|jgi:proteasome beta subunit|nr:proteasome subunit beta [archaeon]MBT7128323.1 proteasome subunit beta [archaeon]
MDEDLKKNILATGTSLVGIVCKDGVVMASDKKVTMGGQLVADKNFQKTHKINDYLIMSMAGTVSDAQVNHKLIGAQLKIKELKDRKRPTVKESVNFIATMKFQTIRRPSMIPSIVGNLVAGVDTSGKTSLYNIGPDGAIVQVTDYDASGSGMQYIWGLLERQYKENLTIEQGVELAIEGIKSSSQRDTASGCGIDVFTITKDGIKHVAKQKVETVYKEHN